MSEKIDKAMSLFKEGKYKESIDTFHLVLENEPDNADVYNNLAVAYTCVADFEHAETYFIKALELDPQLAQAYINLSDLYYKAGDLASAVGTLQRGSYELQDNLTIAHLLARVYIDDQRWEDAIEELRGRFGKKAITYGSLLGNLKMPDDGRHSVKMPGQMYS